MSAQQATSTEGRVVAAPADEKGLKRGEEVELTPGESVTFEGEIENLNIKGFDFSIIDREPEKIYMRRYARDTYKTTTSSVKGEFSVIPYDDEGPDYTNGVIINTGETVVQEKEIN